jgi:hypothetical protein
MNRLKFRAVALRAQQNEKEIGVKEYKVLTQKDRFFGGKFDPEKLEKAINSYATGGWSVVSVATASIPSLTGTREMHGHAGDFREAS